MVAIMILTHGSLGKALLDVAEMMLGPQQNIAVVSLQPADSIDDFKRRTETAVNNLQAEQGILFLADIPGGSPANTSLRWVSRGEGFLVTGVNAPMLLELLNARQSLAVAELAQKAKEWGNQGIIALTPAHIAKL